MANRQYKDTVFRRIFNHEREIAALYQAIRQEDDIRPEDITITTLDNVFLSSQRNDLSFLWSMKNTMPSETPSCIASTMAS